MDQVEQHTAMLLAHGVPPNRYSAEWRQWDEDTDKFLLAAGYTTLGQRRAQKNGFHFWVEAMRDRGALS